MSKKTTIAAFALALAGIAGASAARAADPSPNQGAGQNQPTEASKPSSQAPTGSGTQQPANPCGPAKKKKATNPCGPSNPCGPKKRKSGD